MTKTEFSLFAPDNNEVALLGDFNDWRPEAMTKGDVGYFRTEVELPDGEHRFRVRSKSWFSGEDAWLETADPCATAVEDSKDRNSLLRIRSGERFLDDDAWQHDGALLP